MRRAAAALLLAGLALTGAAGRAGAHGDTITFLVTARGDGHTRSVASWADDGHPVTETLAATLSAVSDDGRTLGPWPLLPVAGTEATFTTADALPPGHWKVTVESGFPALGRGEADLTVTAVPEGAPSGTASTGAAGPPAPAVTPDTAGPSAGGAQPTRADRGVKAWIAAAVALASCTALGLALAARRKAYRAGRSAAA